MPNQTTQQDKFRVAQMMAACMVFIAPAVYLVIAYVLERQEISFRPQPILFYLFLAMALVQIPAIPVVRRLVIGSLRKRTISTNRQDQALQVCIIGLTQAEACFVTGLIAFMISRDHQLLYYFYPIGIVASIIAWPTRERFDALVAQLEEA